MSEPFVGEIRIVGFQFAPRGWAFCDGQLMPISQNPTLFSLLGTTYGGDGRTTFALPDLRGRVPIHQGRTPGSDDHHRLGDVGGTERVALDLSAMPAHTHLARLQAHEGDADAQAPGGNALAKSEGNAYAARDPAVEMRAGSIEVEETGGGQPHDNMQPFLCVNFIIALEGLYPSRS